MEKIMMGMDRQERAMEISARALLLHENIKWSDPEIWEVEDRLYKVKTLSMALGI